MVFMCGHINEGVRALNPENYVEVEVVKKAEADIDEASDADAACLADVETEAELVEAEEVEIVEAVTDEETAEPAEEAETAETEDAKNE
ncbi:MAG: hypothetical protein ACI4KJ_02785, partial [Anaerovoracaceae bacterium]